MSGPRTFRASAEYAALVRNGYAPADRSAASFSIRGPSAASTRRSTGTSSSSRYALSVAIGLAPCAPPRPTVNRPGADASSSAYVVLTSAALYFTTARIPLTNLIAVVAPTRSVMVCRPGSGPPDSQIAGYPSSSAARAAAMDSALLSSPVVIPKGPN
nr:hypothetical protein [Kribbella sp. VKM Ac-2566]